MTDPGFKVTIQQDFFSLAGGEIVPKSRQKSIEMYKPKQWKDQTNLQFRSNLAGTVIKVRIEVGPADRESREDMNKFVKEMVEENSTPGQEIKKSPLFMFLTSPFLLLKSKS